MEEDEPARVRHFRSLPEPYKREAPGRVGAFPERDSEQIGVQNW